MKDKEFEFIIFDPLISPTQNWELYKQLYIDPYPEKLIINTKYKFDDYLDLKYNNKKTPKK